MAFVVKKLFVAGCFFLEKIKEESTMIPEKIDNEVFGKVRMMPTQYDLERFQDYLQGEPEIIGVFQPSAQIRIDLSGGFNRVIQNRLPGEKPQSIEDIIAYFKTTNTKAPPELLQRTTFVPNFKVHITELKTLLGRNQVLNDPVACGAIAEAIFKLNKLASTEYFVLPEFFALNSNTFPLQTAIFQKFKALVKDEFPHSKLGLVISPDMRMFASPKSENLIAPFKADIDFIVFSKKVRMVGSRDQFLRAIRKVEEMDLDVFCFNAPIFVKGFPFAASLVCEDIVGFSFEHGGRRPPRADPIYYCSLGYNQSKTRFWTWDDFREAGYGTTTPLSTFCPCDVCARFNLDSWFAQDRNNNGLNDIRHRFRMIHFHAIELFDIRKIKTLESMNTIGAELSTITVATLCDMTDKAFGENDIEAPVIVSKNLSSLILFWVKKAKEKLDSARLFQLCFLSNDKITKQEFVICIKQLLFRSHLKFVPDESSGRSYFELG